MKNKGKGHPNQCVITVFMVLSIASIAFLTYRDMLGYFFTATDSLTLIDTSRIQSFSDVVRIFTEPLMNGTTFVEIARFYRPIATLSYSLDYSIWELNPFGYHLTDLILHILVSVLVFFLIRFLTNGKRGTAWLGAIIFATHPILVETVPAIARRNDIMAALFLVLSLLLFLKHLSTVSHKRGFLLSSIFFYALALGVKEMAIILPFLIFTYLIAFSCWGEKTFKTFEARLVQAVKSCLPYLIVTFVLLAWRVYILQGIGGYMNRSFEVFRVVQSLINIVTNYSVDILNPVGYLKSPFSPSLSTFEQVGYLVVLFSLFIFLLVYRRTIFRIVCYTDGRLLRALKILLATVVILSILSLTAFLVYPLISPYITPVIQQAYHGEGPKFPTGAMEVGHILRVGPCFYKARYLIPQLLPFSLFFSTICLIAIHQRDKIKRLFTSSDSGKVVFLLLIWLSLPLGIHLLTRTFAHRNMYIPVIPFSAILSVLLVEGFQFTIRRIMAREYHSSGSSYRSSLIKSTVSFIIIAGLLVSLLAYSPLVRTYGQWEDSGNISSMFLYRLSGIVTELPNDAVIHVYNLPSGISSYRDKIPHAKEVAYLDDYSIKSWLDINYPNNHMEVVVHSRSELVVCPDYLDLETKRGKDNNVVIIVRFDGGNGT